MKMLWSGIKSIINIENNKFHNISQIVQNGVAINDPKEIVKVFNHYFTNIASKIDNEIPRSRKSPSDYLGNKCESSFFLSPTDSAEIENVIAELKKGKASGPYSIPGHFLNCSVMIVLPVLKYLSMNLLPQAFFQLN